MILKNIDFSFMVEYNKLMKGGAKRKKLNKYIFMKRLSILLDDVDVKLIIKQKKSKNYNFLYLYRMNKKHIMKILKQLKILDFIKSVKSNHPYHVGDILYIFSPTFELIDYSGKKCIVKLYIKIHVDFENKMITIISFHEYNKFN